MVEEIPIEPDAPEPEILEAPETQPETQPEIPVMSSESRPEPKKRGRPKKETPKPPEPPKRKPGRPKKSEQKPQPPQETPPERSSQPEIDPFRATLDTMSSAALVAELVNRRRAFERQMKQELYRSFVM
jgi:hypothetical protein